MVGEQIINVIRKAVGDEDPMEGITAEPSVQPDDGDKSLKERSAVIADITANFALLERAVANFDARYTLRVLRSLNTLRKRFTGSILVDIIKKTFPPSHPALASLESILTDGSSIGNNTNHDDTAMDVDTDIKPAEVILPEVDIYLHLAVQVYLLDQGQFEKGARFSDDLVKRMHGMNRRTLDSLAAKVYFYYSIFNESLPGSEASIAIRAQLLASLRTATLRKDIDTQATIIVLLLRNYLSTSHISQADLLVTHAAFPETAANNLFARYSYYLGRIRAIQLDYSSAHEYLISATRKAPQVAVAAGFVQAANKLNIIVELLMGDIPERSIFRQPMLEKPLRPYLALVRAVRVGELDAFQTTVNLHAETFKRDGTYTLISRLRQNVIKTGIRMMSIAYSKISLRDICVRLRLDSEESAEYIVAKAIRDGVIEAGLNNEKGYMQSKELTDVYATKEPQDQFHERIKFCMQLHNECVTAMRFPMNQHRLELKNAQEARERERELVKEIQSGDRDDDDGDFEGI
ncbi:26S proteasome non-ATPase regulatory subunit [Orbilia oligospora]|uniref:26S proteasome non-ATPase regulatory subunit n=1 Tax=Orbilia oligospora TaxID=2813651 RepID=A0A6G1LW22_ORBOL|nr:26S proteasome non-ATPase regulatory subunit [Orbilia oligospora]KAF3236452.1 26S proteasome non-ATPase regulatory subunit [Orbilia oligospora]